MMLNTNCLSNQLHWSILGVIITCSETHSVIEHITTVQHFIPLVDPEHDISPSQCQIQAQGAAEQLTQLAQHN